MLRDPGQHSRTELVLIVEREYEVGPADAAQDAMGARFTFELPANAEKRGQDSPGLRGTPTAHAA